MPYVERNENGHIIRVSDDMDDRACEFMEVDHPDVRAHKAVVDEVKKSLAFLNDSDAEVMRVSEDLIELLIEKNIIMLTDLPAPAQEKLARRKSARDKMNHLETILLEEDSIL